MKSDFEINFGINFDSSLKKAKLSWLGVKCFEKCSEKGFGACYEGRFVSKLFENSRLFAEFGLANLESDSTT